MLFNRLKDFGKDASLYGMSQIVGQLIGFFLIPLYTTYLTPTDYGVMTLLGFYTLFYSPLSHLGFQGAMFRFVGLSKKIEDESSYISTAVKPVVVIAVFFSLLSQAFVGILEKTLLNSQEYTVLLTITIWGALPASLSQFGYSLLRVKRKVQAIFWLNNFNFILSVGLNIWFIVGLKMGLMGITLAGAFSGIIAFLSVWYFANIPINKDFNKSKFKEMALYGLPNVPHYLFAIVMMFFGQYMINRMLSPGDLGLYAIAWKFCLPLAAIVGIIQSSWSAYKLDLVRTDEHSKDTLGKFALLIIMIFVILYMTLVAIGPYALELMANNAYHDAGRYIGFLALIPLFNGIYYSLGSGISLGAKQYLIPAISATGCCAAIGTSFLFIPSFGIPGAGISTSIGWATMAILGLFYGQSNFKINFDLKRIFSLVCISIASLLVFHFTPLFLFQKLIVFTVFLSLSIVVLPKKDLLSFKKLVLAKIKTK
jgi:O-antigen/teichoic acid export membrane protein